MARKTKLIVAALSAITLSPMILHAQDTRRSDVIVTISNLKTSSGQMRCAMFRSANGFPREPEKAAHRVIGTISGKTGTCIFSSVSAGSAAISAFHDENGNQKLDLTFGIIPKEGIGWSNNPKVRMKPPSFPQAQIMIGNQPIKVQIKLNQR
jgi:uncharacterized protein (DUF2141 family)